MDRLIIEPEKKGRGRSFRAVALAWVEANGLWSGGETDTETMRPVWIMIAGSSQEIRAFIANLRAGRKAIVGTSSRRPPRIEMLRSAGYQWIAQTTRDGAIMTGFLPDLFRYDPSMVDPSAIRFCMLPPAAWAHARVGGAERAMQHLSALGIGDTDLSKLPVPASLLVPYAALFCTFLDRRTRCPLLNDERFFVQLMLACLDIGMASFGSQGRYGAEWGVNLKHGFIEHGTNDVGLLPGITFGSSHDGFETLLAEQVSLFFDVSKEAHYG